MFVGYGKKIREKLNATRSQTKANYKCPSCSRTSIKRFAMGVWVCSKCNKKFASNAYNFGE